MKNLKFLLPIICCPIIAYSSEKKLLDDFFYIGIEGGIVAPVKSKFLHKESKTNITLKKSDMYTGQIGYSFYPGMSIEFSSTYQPRYKLAYDLPANNFIPYVTPGNTKVVSKVYTINLIYDLNKYKNFTPYVIFGAGIAQVTVKPTSSSFQNIEFFKIKKTRKNCKVWQVGLGLSKEVTDNLSINFSGKLQVAHNVRINYQTLDIGTGKFVNAAPIKKTIGVAEYGIGFNYKLPF